MFNSNRMVRQYAERYYLPALRHFARLGEANFAGAARLADWKQFVHQNWNRIRLVRFEADVREEMVVGSAGSVRAWIEMAPLLPQDLSVEVVHGRIGLDFAIEEAGSVPMVFESSDEHNYCIFRGVVPCVRSGKFGFAIRILPRHRDLPNPYQTGLIKIFEA